MIVQVPGWSAYPWLRHGFSNRSGGVSTVYRPQGSELQSTAIPRGELNLGWTKDDDPANVEENRLRLVAAVTGSRTTPLITVRQIHAAASLVVEESDPVSGFVTDEGRAIHEGDGLMTSAAGVLLGIQTADCVPVLVADVERRVVSAFHAGWRGTVAGIVERGVAQMTARFGSRPEDMVAAIGPSIGVCCYTVGEPIRDAFTSAYAYGEDLFRVEDASCAASRANGGVSEPTLSLDLWEANRRQLLDAGVAESRITVVGECTGCTGLPGDRRYFSHRCEHGFTGRMMNVIGVV